MNVNNGERVSVVINDTQYDVGLVKTSSGTFMSFPRGTITPPVRAEFYLNEKPHYVESVEVNRSSGFVTLKVMPK